MPTLGQHDYPYYTDIDDAITAAKKIATNFADRSFGRSELAALLKYNSPSTGAFNQRMADLRLFGIIEGRADSIQASELSQRLATATQSEYAEAVTELVYRIPLLKALHERFRGTTPTDEELLSALIHITGEKNRVVAQKHAGKIRSLYIKAASKIQTMPPSTSPQLQSNADNLTASRGGTSAEKPPTPPASTGIKPITMGDIYILCPPGDEDKAIQLLELQRGPVKRGKTPKGTS